MATNLMPADDFSAHKTSEFSLWNGVKQVLEPFASLKLTVILFAMSIFLILAGTLAQVDKDIWEVISLYFRCWFAWIPLQVFFPRSFFIDDPLIVPGGFYFSGGKLLGLLLAVNLASAHLVRFKAAASGMRLAAGFLGIGLGCLATWAIVVAGGNSKGIQGDPFLSYSTQWIAYQGLLAFGVLVCGTGFVYLCQKPLSGSSRECVRQLFLRGLLAVAGVGLAGLVTSLAACKGDGREPKAQSPPQVTAADGEILVANEHLAG